MGSTIPPTTPRQPAGLCDSCTHQKLIGNTRGSTFSLCLKAREDDAFPKYPRLPVVECPGYAPDAARRASSS
jgi:hypothetical protein